MADLTGKVALITGSSRDIGRAIALAFADAGAYTVVHYRSAQTEAEEVSMAIRQMRKRSAAFRADVRRTGEVIALVHDAVSEFGQIDVLVNNAGYASVKPFLDTTEDEWIDQFQTLTNGYFRFARAVLPRMVDQRSGVILNIASTCGIRGSAGERSYAAANGAIVGMTRSLASEFRPQGIRVNALLVAWASNAFDPSNSDHRSFLPDFALRRVTDVTEIAKAAVFLCSDAAAGISGATLPVDAGCLCG